MKNFISLKMSFLFLSGVLVNQTATAEPFKTVLVNNGLHWSRRVDDSGLAWSKEVNNLYSNGCADKEEGKDISQCTLEKNEQGDLVLDSEGNPKVDIKTSLAAQACQRIGGRLPTKPEWESLIRNFDHTEEFAGPRLTESGRASMQAQFGDMDNWFFTSSVVSSNPEIAYIFYFFTDGLIAHQSRDFGAGAVRCVSGVFTETPKPKTPEVKRDFYHRVAKSTGAVFKLNRDAGLGDNAWMDPSGLTWGAITYHGGELVKLDRRAAEAYCGQYGARVPTKKDYERLGEYLGNIYTSQPNGEKMTDMSVGYSTKTTDGAEVLDAIDDRIELVSIDSVAPRRQDYYQFYVFIGSDGHFEHDGYTSEDWKTRGTFRCVK